MSGLPSPPRPGWRSLRSVSDQHPARPPNLGGVLLCSGGLGRVTVLHVALHLAQLLSDLEQGGWVCAEARLDARSPPGGPQALSAATAPRGTCSDERGLCGLPCRFSGGRRPAPRPLTRVKLQLRDPRGAQTGLVHTFHSLQGQWHGAQRLLRDVVHAGLRGAKQGRGPPRPGPHHGPSSHRPRVEQTCQQPTHVPSDWVWEHAYPAPTAQVVTPRPLTRASSSLCFWASLLATSS